VYVPTCPTFSAIVITERDSGTWLPTVVGVRDTKGDLFIRPLIVLLDFLAGTCCPLPPPLLLKPLPEKMPESGEKLPESSTNTFADDQTVSIVVLSLLLDVSLLTNVAVVAARRICERGNRLGDGDHGFSRGVVRAAYATRERAGAMRDQMSVNLRHGGDSIRGLFARRPAAADGENQSTPPPPPPVDDVPPPPQQQSPPPRAPPRTPRDERRPVVTPRRQAPPTPLLFRSGTDLIEAFRELQGGDIFE
jgi:hypothetical protein